MASSRRIAASAALRAPIQAAAAGATGACALAVAGFGELSPGALVAVAVMGLLVLGRGLVRRSGADAPRVSRPHLFWVVLGAALAVFEVLALASAAVPTVSDLADPALAVPEIRATATVIWCVAGVRLADRPAGAVAAVMRRTPGRVAVLAGWLWLGIHFLAR